MNEEIKQDDTIILDNYPIIMRIPKGAVALDITASIIVDEQLQKVTAKFDNNNIFQFRKDFMDYVGDDDFDAVYTLTDEGRNYLEELRARNGELYDM